MSQKLQLAAGDFLLMIKHMSRSELYAIFFAVLIISTGYGVSFPLLAIKLEGFGLSASYIGLNAAMPAFGWLVLTPLLPRLQRRFGLKSLALFFLCCAALSVCLFWRFENYWIWLVGRFLFGGSLGMFFRVIEYWMNAIANAEKRGRLLGIYIVIFCLGIAIGSLTQPLLQTGAAAFLAIIVSAALSVVIIAAHSKLLVEPRKNSRTLNFRDIFKLAPVALAGVVTYGLYEDIPAYLLSVYALKSGLGEAVAAYTLTAVALGNLLFPIPMGMLSDRIGRAPVLIFCVALSFLGTVVLPFAAGNPSLFLALLVPWGGCAGSIYCVSLAMIGDHFDENQLIGANAIFGTFYAAAALLGPLFNGTAMSLLEPNGLMVGAGVIFGGFLIYLLLIRRGSGNVI